MHKTMKSTKQINELMFDVIKKLEKRHKAFENKIKKVNKNIESILKILIN